MRECLQETPIFETQLQACHRHSLRSPGQVTAQVTENVYDSPTGRFLLIPHGSKLVGT
jgi:hypothetical protein